MKFGGWLILPLLALCMSPILTLYNMFKGSEGFFQQKTWLSMDFTDKPIPGHFLYGIEFLLNVILLANILFLLVIFINKRDTLPKKMIWMFYGYNIFMQVLDISILAIDGYEIEYNLWKDLFRSVFGAAIWIPYFQVSQRVKRTFVNRFSS